MTQSNQYEDKELREKLVDIIDENFEVYPAAYFDYERALGSFTQLITQKQLEAEDRVIDIAHKPCECGKPHYATPVRSVQGNVTSYCQFSHVVLSELTKQEGKG